MFNFVLKDWNYYNIYPFHIYLVLLLTIFYYYTNMYIYILLWSADSMAANSENVFHSLKLLFVYFIHAFIFDTCIYFLPSNYSKL